MKCGAIQIEPLRGFCTSKYLNLSCTAKFPADKKGKCQLPDGQHSSPEFRQRRFKNQVEQYRQVETESIKVIVQGDAKRQLGSKNTNSENSDQHGKNQPETEPRLVKRVQQGNYKAGVRSGCRHADAFARYTAYP